MLPGDDHQSIQQLIKDDQEQLHQARDRKSSSHIKGSGKSNQKCELGKSANLFKV